MPRPHPKKGERDLVNLDHFLGLAGSVGACRHCSSETNFESDWSLARLRAGRHFKFIQQAIALCIPVIGESYDCAKAAISLERSNVFPWPKDCVQIHQTHSPPQGWGLGTRLAPIQTYANNHMIAELAEPRISTNVPRPFPPLGVGSGDKTSSNTNLCK